MGRIIDTGIMQVFFDKLATLLQIQLQNFKFFFWHDIICHSGLPQGFSSCSIYLPIPILTNNPTLRLWPDYPFLLPCLGIAQRGHQRLSPHADIETGISFLNHQSILHYYAQYPHHHNLHVM